MSFAYISREYPSRYTIFSGNQQIYPNVLCYGRFSGNAAWLEQHYAKLRQFTNYLIEYSLIPGIQLSTGQYLYLWMRFNILAADT